MVSVTVRKDISDVRILVPTICTNESRYPFSLSLSLLSALKVTPLMRRALELRWARALT